MWMALYNKQNIAIYNKPSTANYTIIPVNFREIRFQIMTIGKRCYPLVRKNVNKQISSHKSNVLEENSTEFLIFYVFFYVSFCVDFFSFFFSCYDFLFCYDGYGKYNLRNIYKSKNVHMLKKTKL